MSEETKSTCRAGHGAVLSGPIWFIGWLFTVGYVHLVWWKAILAIVVWPYFLGVALK